jgi:hypothetical protein
LTAGTDRKEKKNMAYDARDVRRVAWEVAEKATEEPAMQKKIAKDVANALWTNLCPESDPWVKVPAKP